MIERARASAVVLAILSSMVFSSCSERNEYVPPPPPTVTVSPPAREKVTEYMEFTGRTVAIASVEVRARVKGFLESQRFEEGDVVQKDDVLFIIDPSEYRATVDGAQASVGVAEAQLGLAEATYQRMESAVKTNAVSKLEALESEARRDAAKATLAERHAALARVKLDLDYTEIRAPIAGTVGRRLVDVGDLVGAGENTLVTTIVQYDPIYADFDMSERDLLALMKRRLPRVEESPKERLERIRKIPLEMGLANDEGYPHSGHVHVADQGLDPETGTLLLRGVFPNPHPPVILPGLFVRVRVPGDEAEALLVSERALGSDQGGKYLLVVDKQNVVQHRSVVVGQKLGGRVVIESGIEPHDSVIVKGILRARPGGKVTPQDQEASAGSPEASGG